jgi:hypothetical protein
MNKSAIAAIALGVFVITGVGFGLYTRTHRAPAVSSVTSDKKTITVGNDVCGEFPKEWVSTVIGIPVVKTEVFNTNIIHVCNYFVGENKFVSIHHETYNVEDQKKGLLFMDRKLEQDPRIHMEHFVVWQDKGVINNIYLVLGTSDYLTVSRSGTDVIDNEKNIQFAVAVANRIVKGENTSQAIYSSPTGKATSVVPLPQETDIIRSFIAVIGEGRPADAVSMLAPDQINDDSSKQAWAAQFNAFSSLKVTSVEPSLQEDWSDTQHEYKVILNATMKPESASATIPYYGWDNGSNTRWITIVKIGNLWKISGIATGP